MKQMKIKLNTLIVLVALMVTGLTTNAQRFNVESIKMDLEDPSLTDADRDFDQLLKWAEETKNHPKTSNDPKMWYYRGLVYLKVANLNNEITKANPDAIKIALKSFNNAIETDAKNKVTKMAKGNLLNVAIGLYNSGYNAYQNEDFGAAYDDFSMALPLMKYDTDGLLKQSNLTADVLEQMRAFSAMNNGEDGKAMKAFEGMINKGSIDPMVYANLANLHLKGGDTTKALEVVKDGREMNETDKTLTNLKLNIYMSQGRSQELISELDEAIAGDPGNVVYYFARANSFEAMGELDKAASDYDKILEIDPSYYDAAYNKGVMYLNKVSNVVDELDGVYKPSIIAEKEAEIMGYYKLAIVQFENVFENNDDMPIEEKVELGGTMKKIYARLEKMDKYQDMKAFVEQNQ